MARVLVVGGAGYVGGWLVDRAIDAGHDVQVYDLLLYEDRFLKDVPFISGDVLDRASVERRRTPGPERRHADGGLVGPAPDDPGGPGVLGHLGALGGPAGSRPLRLGVRRATGQRRPPVHLSRAGQLGGQAGVDVSRLGAGDRAAAADPAVGLDAQVLDSAELRREVLDRV